MESELKTRVTADASAAIRGVAAFAKQSEKLVGNIGKELTSRLAGAFAAGALVSAVQDFGRSVLGAVDDVKDLSDQLGLSVEEVQRLQKAANDAGTKFGTVNTALQKIEAMRSQAMSGDGKAMGIFEMLGIDPSKGTSVDVLRQAVEASANGAERQAALLDLVGRKAGILKLVVQELKSQGPIILMTPEQIANIDQVNARWEETVRQAKALATGPMAWFIDSLNRAADAWGKLITGLRDVMPRTGNPVEPTLFTDERRSGGLKKLSYAGLMLTGGALLGRGVEERLSAAMGFPPPRRVKTPDDEGRDRDAGTGVPKPQPITLPSAAIPLGQPGDALSRIGLFVGSRPEVGALRSIDRNTADTARQVSEANRILREILAANSGI